MRPNGTCYGADNPNRRACYIEPPPRSWHLLTQSFGGTVSLLKDLTQHECEAARIATHPAWGSVASTRDLLEPGTIVRAECFE